MSAVGGARVEADPIEIGHHIGRYVVRERLGSGGMGVVYAADDPSLDRVVALKLLLSERGPRAAGRRKRLLREAQAMARLKHANVVGVLDVDVHEDRVFITMEYLPGARTVDEWIEEDSPPWEEILEVLLAAGDGLAAAHEAGLVHRDFKPGNVLVSRAGHVRVTDFGLARAVDGDRYEVGMSIVAAEAEAAMATSLTKTGAAIGTPAYMAPEQHRREPVDQRSDQFSFCVALFECLYGLPPFEGNDATALADAVTRGRVRQPPWDTKVDPRIWKVVRRGLIPDRRERFGSLRELLAELRHKPRFTVRRVVFAACVAAAAIGVAVIAAGQLMPTGAACGDGAEQLAGVWDDGRRAQLAGTFGRIQTAYAPEAWSRVQAGLDGYAEAWVAATHRACLATEEGSQPAATQRQRLACLAQRRRALGAVVDVVGTADARNLAHAIEVVRGLPTLPPCDDLGVQGVPSRVFDPADAEAADGRMQRARALLDMARYDEARIEVAAALAQAEALDDASLLARAAYTGGTLASQQGEYAEARVDLEQAFFAAQRSRDPGLAVDAAADLAKIVGVHAADSARGLEWIRHATAAMERLGPDANREAAIVHARAEIETARGDPELARAHASQALALLEAEATPDMPLMAAILNTLGNALRELQQYAEARSHLERVLEIRERLWGNNHPYVAEALNNLGTTEHQLGRSEHALVHFHRAALVMERSLGPEHVAVAGPTMNLAFAYAERGQGDEALRYGDRAVALTQRALGAEALDTLLRRYDRVRLQRSVLGDDADVGEELAAIARRLEENFGEHPRLLEVLLTTAHSALEARAWATAARSAQSALRLLPEPARGDDPERAHLESLLGQAQWALWADHGEPAAAISRVERAEAILRAAGDSWADQASAAAAWLAAHPRSP